MDTATRRRPAPLVVLLFGAALGVLAGMVWAVLAPTTAPATATVHVGTTGIAAVPALPQGADLAQQAAGSYASVAVSGLVLDGVERDLGLHGSAAALARRVDVRRPAGTTLLEITVRDADGAQAARIANAVAARLSTASRELTPAVDGGTLRTSVVQVARASAPDTATGMLLTVLAGLLAGTGIAAVALAARRTGGRPPSGGAVAVA